MNEVKTTIKDEKILIKNTPGIITYPSNFQKNLSYPAVLFFHGFGTNKNEVGDIFKIISENLSKENIISVRIDFSGCGDSEEQLENITIDKYLDNAKDAIDYINEIEFIDKRRLGICGFSLGAAIAVLSLHNKIHEFKSTILISPAGDLVEDFKTYFGENNFKRIEGSFEPVEIDLGWRKVRLKNIFINSLKKFLLKKPLDYSGSFFAISGSEDFSKKHVESYFTLINSKNKTAKIIQGADHIFNAFEGDKNKLPYVSQKSSKWFKQTL